ncbi:hypothetical protein LPB86_16210 [Pedobacter sp. MC2016-14]|uniref:hypothetical protein n=1 Tax=Pedobacter sp. MC2016-14 TaxID=2897327 RepID=UPI001E4E0F69|nr:hypothetical protein [Pedobacter sp. MC2016-14]MCD0489788.1 hypothetical protein [Pedobacter sp. MC2016-14]
MAKRKEVFFIDRLEITFLQVSKLMKCGERNAHRLLAKVRKHFGKSQRQLVTPREFCEVTGSELEVVLYLLNKQ